MYIAPLTKVCDFDKHYALRFTSASAVRRNLTQPYDVVVEISFAPTVLPSQGNCEAITQSSSKIVEK